MKILLLINIVINSHHHLLTRCIKSKFCDKEYHNCSTLASPTSLQRRQNLHNNNKTSKAQHFLSWLLHIWCYYDREPHRHCHCLRMNKWFCSFIHTHTPRDNDRDKYPSETTRDNKDKFLLMVHAKFLNKFLLLTMLE